MFHFDDHANLRELFLDNSGQYDSSNTKYFDDLNAVSKQKESQVVDQHMLRRMLKKSLPKNWMLRSN